MLLNSRRALRVAGAFLAATVVIFLAVALDGGHGPIQDVDDAWLDGMVAVHWAPLIWLAKAMAFTGSVWVNWPLRILALGVLLLKRRWVQFSAFGLAIVSSEVLIGTMKALYARPRPSGSLIATSDFSFPSGHAVAGAVTAVGLVIVLMQPGSRRWKWELRAAIFACLMAASRPYLGAHWLTDVIAGGLLGVTLAIGWPALLQELRDHRRTPVQAPR